ncbi:MAG: DUF3300 domain-containing protein [Rhodanobacter sp.]
MTDLPLARKAAYVLFCSGLVILTGCNKQPDTSSTAPAPASSTAQQAAPYTPPTADQLYQMVAPIALFPDNLVAQVLAGSTYPDQITAANNWLAQNPNLKGASLQTAIASEPWDPSVKGLTAFPSVLDQMAQNTQWTTALGEAYVNDPTDVMNAIQVMRQRAAQHGNLQSSAQQRVVTQPVAAANTTTYVDNGESGEPPVYSGPSVVQAPDQAIEIMPAQEDTVYVPSYNPQTVYGEEVPVYPDYTYVQPGYSTGDLVAVGAVTFGVGILVGSLFDHHHDRYNNPPPAWGWNNWGMRWGGGGGGGNGGGGWQRPTVVYNNSTYVSRSTTVVNRYTTNNYNNRTVNNVNSNNFNSNNRTFNNSAPNAAAQNRNFSNAAVSHVVAGAPQAMMNRPAAQAAPMTMPHFGTPVRGAQPVRNEPSTAMQAYHAAAQPVSRSDIPSRAALQPHAAPGPQAHTPQAYAPQVHNSTLTRTTPQASPSMVTQPRLPPQMREQPAPRPAQPAVTHQPAPQVFNRPQPERAAPAPAPRPEPQAAPRSEFSRPQQQPAPRPAPAPRREPSRAPPPQAAPAEHNNARPAPPPQHAPSKPVKKDDNENGH